MIDALTRTTSSAVIAAFLSACTSLKRFSYEGFDRDAWQHPAEVVAALALPPGARVADLGAGGGYFTFRLAQAVGPEGRVYAVDVDRDMIDYLRARAADEGAANVQTIEAAAEDPLLPGGTIDLVFTCNTYHHLPDRVAYLQRLRPALAPGGRVAVIDYTSHGSWFAWLFGHGTPPEEIRAEFAAAGYHVVATHGFLPRQSFQVFAAD